MKKYKNFVLTTVGEGADVYRVFVNNSGVQFDYNALNTIINNRIAGLVPIACRGNEIGYNIRGLVSLSEMIKEIKRCQAKSALYRLIANTSFVAAGIEQFGLNPDKLIFDPNDMYVDPNTMNVYLLYYPLINVETDTINVCIDNIIEIFKSNSDAPVMACYDKTQEKACETEIQKESDGMVNVQPGCDKEIIEETVQEEIVEEAAENVIPDDNIEVNLFLRISILFSHCNLSVLFLIPVNSHKALNDDLTKEGCAGVTSPVFIFKTLISPILEDVMLELSIK